METVQIDRVNALMQSSFEVLSFYARKRSKTFMDKKAKIILGYDEQKSGHDFTLTYILNANFFT